jgi:gentisate 1,2-dioxygenase
MSTATRQLTSSPPHDFNSDLPAQLITSLAAARWLDPGAIPNPSRIGELPGIATKTLNFYLQEIPPHAASDMHRHAHESIHLVLEGSGHSEIGERRCVWTKGDLVHTPQWCWHRHYNNTDHPVTMLIIENSRLLAALGLYERQSAGLVDFKSLRGDTSDTA